MSDAAMMGWAAVLTRRISTAGLLAMGSTALIGCGDAPMSLEEEIAFAESAVEGSNALNPNALNPNALNPNALNPNALNPNALNPNALSPSALTALQDPGIPGALSRQLVRYTVECALEPPKSFSFTWTDAAGVLHAEKYVGILGLAPGWASHGASLDDQRWVSACLAARTNWYGVPVMISSRGDDSDLKHVPSSEQNAYPHLEGAFWGNLFSQTPYLRACHDPAHDANSRSLLRDCAAGHLDANGNPQDCGMIHIVGSCSASCGSLRDGKYYASCYDGQVGGNRTDTAITVFLP